MSATLVKLLDWIALLLLAALSYLLFERFGWLLLTAIVVLFIMFVVIQHRLGEVARQLDWHQKQIAILQASVENHSQSIMRLGQRVHPNENADSDWPVSGN